MPEIFQIAEVRHGQASRGMARQGFTHRISKQGCGSEVRQGSAWLALARHGFTHTVSHEWRCSEVRLDSARSGRAELGLARQGRAVLGMAKHIASYGAQQFGLPGSGTAWQGTVRPGSASYTATPKWGAEVRLCKVWRGVARRGVASLSFSHCASEMGRNRGARHGLVWSGKVRHGGVRLGVERRGLTRSRQRERSFQKNKTK